MRRLDMADRIWLSSTVPEGGSALVAYWRASKSSSNWMSSAWLSTSVSLW